MDLGWFQWRTLPPALGVVAPVRWAVPPSPTTVEEREGGSVVGQQGGR
jgi:hypothetical protein